MAAVIKKANRRLRRLFYFFPVQLLLVHLKKTHVFLLFWLIMFAFVTEVLCSKYGIPYLFLYPEYMGQVNFTSFAILGFSCGGFIMAFNVSSYIINGFRFPFIATVSRPFMKYSINNFIIPVCFLIVYLWKMISFQIEQSFDSPWQITVHVIGFLTGVILFISMSFLYFISTNKNIFALFGIKEDDPANRSKREKAATRKGRPIKTVLHRKKRWYNVFNPDRKWHVETYLSGLFKISLARDSRHYGKTMLKSVFEQNHINASIFEVLVISTILILGLFREVKFFAVPAGASVFVLFTMLMMIFSAIHSWLRGWTTTVFIVLLLLINYASQYNFLQYDNFAYGLNYEVPKAKYSSANLKKNNASFDNVAGDIMHHIAILNQWKHNVNALSVNSEVKPKLVLINTSGGGLRSSVWTMRVLQVADSLTSHQLMKNSRLITGSSGGMIGAAYFRELYLRSLQNNSVNIYDRSYIRDIGSDLLNQVTFTMAVNDLFLRLQKHKVGQHSYTKDRGYAFEKQLNENTGWVLNKTIGDYYQPEADATIPLMLLSPTVVNDGRRVLISPQPISFLTRNEPYANITNQALVESIEFSRFFNQQEADSLLFTSALRMNATFPYIMPFTALPSDPPIEVMDAGIRDNFGLSTSLKYLYTFRNWISENTSGVVILQIRDKQKDFEIDDSPKRTIWQALATPLGSFYTNWVNIQNFNQDQLLQYAGLWFPGTIDVVSFELQRNTEGNVSLSWHLTDKEKQDIMEAIHRQDNQESLGRLVELLKPTPLLTLSGKD